MRMKMASRCLASKSHDRRDTICVCFSFFRVGEGTPLFLSATTAILPPTLIPYDGLPQEACDTNGEPQLFDPPLCLPRLLSSAQLACVGR